MAPNWNIVGDYLVHGREFLTDPMKKSILKVDIDFTPGKFTITLSPLSMTIPAISLGDLDISHHTIQAFESDEHIVIPQQAIGSKWCHILPSNKKGQVFSISHTLPTSGDGGFKSYKDMKRYWKNTYGYRLPDSDENLLYYQINFKLIGNKLFTYPSVCVRQSGYISQIKDRQALCDTFISDIRTLMKSVCGVKISLSRNAHNATPQLYTIPTNHSLPSRPNTVPVVCKTSSLSDASLQQDKKSAGTNTEQTTSTTSDSLNLTRETVVTLPDNEIKGQNLGSSGPIKMKPQIPSFLIKQRVKSKTLTNDLSVTSAVRTASTNHQQGGINLKFSDKLSTKNPVTPLFKKNNNQSAPTGISAANRCLGVKSTTGLLPVSILKTPKAVGVKRDISCIQTPTQGSKKMKTTEDSSGDSHAVIMSLINTGTISKASNACLTSWLKQRGVTVRTKDKKEDLISKVMTALKIEQ